MRFTLAVSHIRRRVLAGARTSTLISTAFLAVAVVVSANAQEAVAERVVVEADRLPNAESGAPFSIHVVDENELRRAPQLRLDDILRAQVPGFSLFRRNSSRTANPTTQGVTLRNFGPSGAGRTLVLLDGIPVNDPFAGYVLWSQVPPASIESVLVNSGWRRGVIRECGARRDNFSRVKTDGCDFRFRGRIDRQCRDL